MNEYNLLKKKKFMITGGAGFIGSSLIRFLINETNNDVLNFDKLTYSSSLYSLEGISKNPRYNFIKGDVCDKSLVLKTIKNFQPDIIMHLAAETHVDRSIDNPQNFLFTNILGTSVMLECAKEYWMNLKNNKFIFHHVSTDEVYGSIDSGLFTEKTKYDPSSPYSASKASSDFLVSSWNRTYGLPTIITNCSNNYGPYQFPEKLIPLIILNAIEGKPLPVYGNGKNIRDWLFVDDHVRALYSVVVEGKVGEMYNIGGNNELTNIDVVIEICKILDELIPIENNENFNLKNDKIDNINIKIKNYKNLITFVPDRPGHDFRYAINSSKIKKEINWSPKNSFNTGLKKTVKWYLKNLKWCNDIQKGYDYRQRFGLL